MFGIGRRKGRRRGLFSPRTGIMSAVALGIAYAGRQLWKKRKGGVSGLREQHPQSSEWTPAESRDTTPNAPSYG